MGRVPTQYARLPGVRPPAAAPPEAAAAPRQDVKPQLVDVLPTLVHRVVYATEINLPANTDFGASGENVSACYNLGSFKPLGNMGEEFALVGANLELSPSDSAGGLTTVALGAASSTGWGATDGYSAAVVVMENSGIAPKTWAPMAVFAPGLENFSFCLDSPDPPPEYVEVTTFPTGKLSDTTPNKLYLPISYLPTQRPITGSDSVDIILAIRRTQLATVSGGRYTTGVSAKALRCGIRVTPRYMKTLRSAFYRR